MDESDKKYWKCLEDLNQDPGYLKDNAAEFPEGRPSRRDFLKLMGFTVSTASLVACSRAPIHKAIPFLNKPEELTPGLANWYATTCGGCDAGCSLLVKSRDGRPIKVEGNPQSPMTHGGACAVGQASLLSLYDEARLSGPQWKGQGMPWQRFDEKVRASLRAVGAGGQKVVLLTGTVLSPTTKKLIKAFLSNFPQGEHIQFDPISVEAIRLASENAFGLPVLPAYRLDRAKVVVGLNADFLGAWISPVEFTDAYAKNRKLQKPVVLSKHYQLEADFSLTGSNADKRIPIGASEEPAVILALLSRVRQHAGQSAVSDLPPSSVKTEVLDKIAEELWINRGSSLVLSGSNDVRVHLGVHALNSFLGNIGHTVDLDNPSFQKQGSDVALSRLLKEMKQGKVGALLADGVNPAYDNPLSADFKKAIPKLSFSLSFSNYRNETAALTTAIAPGLNYLESWNDAEPKANLYHLQQPLIAPLFDNRAFQDSLLRWMNGSGDYYAYLQEYWAQNIFPKQSKHLLSKKFWNQCLHDGVFAAPQQVTQNYPLKVSQSEMLTKLKQSLGTANEGMELVLYESVALRDGRNANNPWNQELPDPVTKVTWDNFAKLAPSTAHRLGLKEGDILQVTGAAGAVKLPVHLQPGLHPKNVSVALGYGRTGAGKVGDRVGKDLYPWVIQADETFVYTGSAVTLKKTGDRAKLATTQTHGRMEGRPIIKETELKKWEWDPKAGNEDHPPLESLWPKWGTGPENWGLAIDLNACTGCSACVISCQVENNVPVVGKDEVWRRREMHWIRIDRYYSGSEAEPEVAHQPMLCQHCADAPCETVCPVLATVHSSDGLNQQVYNRCVGTRYCANNCPYKVRRFNWFDYADNSEFDYYLNNDLGKMVLNPDVVVRSRGVMEKCSMCIQRIQEGKLMAKQEGKDLKDGEIKMACEQSCPSQAIVFGNLKDPESRVAKSTRDPRYYRVLEELGVRPNVGYLTKVRNKG